MVFHETQPFGLLGGEGGGALGVMAEDPGLKAAVDGFTERLELGIEADGETHQRDQIGELALIPNDSPISNLGILFYNTLFDENASCHIALGLGFPNVIKDYDKYTLDEIHDKGVNDSVIHVDFMVGDATMNIDGITPDGEVIPVFRNGNWTEKFM